MPALRAGREAVAPLAAAAGVAAGAAEEAVAALVAAQGVVPGAAQEPVAAARPRRSRRRRRRPRMRSRPANPRDHVVARRPGQPLGPGAADHGRRRCRVQVAAAAGTAGRPGSSGSRCRWRRRRRSRAAPPGSRPLAGNERVTLPPAPSSNWPSASKSQSSAATAPSGSVEVESKTTFCPAAGLVGREGEAGDRRRVGGGADGDRLHLDVGGALVVGDLDARRRRRRACGKVVGRDQAAGVVELRRRRPGPSWSTAIAPSGSVEVEVRLTCWPASGAMREDVEARPPAGCCPGGSAPQAAPQSTVTVWPRATSTVIGEDASRPGAGRSSSTPRRRGRAPGRR